MTAAGESLQAYVIKMLRQVEESRGDGSEREGRRHYVGEGLSDRISLQTSCSIYRSEEERDPHMCNPCFFRDARERWIEQGRTGREVANMLTG